MSGKKNWNTIYEQAQEELRSGSFNEAAELFKKAARAAESTEEKLDALTQALYIYIRPKDVSSFQSAADISAQISRLRGSSSPVNASLFEKIAEYYSRLQDHEKNGNHVSQYEPLLLKIKDCFLHMEDFFATAFILRHLAEITLGNYNENEIWRKKRIHYIREAAYLYERIRSWIDAAKTFTFAGRIAREQKKYVIMEDCLLKAAECFIKGHNIKEAGICYDSISMAEGLADISKQLKYSMIALEYALPGNDTSYTEDLITRTERLIEKEPDLHKQKDSLIILASLAVKGKYYRQGIQLYEKICSTPQFDVTDDEKADLLKQIQHLTETL